MTAMRDDADFGHQKANGSFRCGSKMGAKPFRFFVLSLTCVRNHLPKPVSEINVSRGGKFLQSVLEKASKGSRRHRVTISDMAEALGLTKSTVSRAMNGYPDISEATQLRVKRMAEKLSYRPLSHAQAIKTGRTRSLGLVLQFSDHDAQRPFLAEFLAGLSSGAHAEGWTLTVASSDSHEDMIETFRSLLRDGKADGFILPRAMRDDPRVKLLRDADVPFVLFGRQDSEDGCAWFDILGEEAMRDAVAHLVSLGHRRIGFINGGTQYAYAALREDGFRQGMREAGLNVDDSLIEQDAVTIADGARAAARLLTQDDAPTAIVCAVDFAALGAYQAIDASGFQVGRDVSVVGYDGIPEGAHAQPKLTTYSVDNKVAGERLSKLLIRRVRGEQLSELRETASAIFVEGGSTGPVPTSDT